MQVYATVVHAHLKRGGCLHSLISDSIAKNVTHGHSRTASFWRTLACPHRTIEGDRSQHSGTSLVHVGKSKATHQDTHTSKQEEGSKICRGNKDEAHVRKQRAGQSGKLEKDVCRKQVHSILELIHKGVIALSGWHRDGVGASCWLMNLDLYRSTVRSETTEIKH